MYPIAKKAFSVVLFSIMTISLFGLLGYLFLQGSIALKTGEYSIPELNAPVTVARDRKGIPTIKGENRGDIAFALGFLHGQERFFQMDLLRRRAAGELSELVGIDALDLDKSFRLHRFRQRAQLAFESLSSSEQALLVKYTDGVNQGLSKLITRPFEYALLRVRPKAWQYEDAFLTLYSIYLELQKDKGNYERSVAVLKDQLPLEWVNFLMPQSGSWDAIIFDEPGTNEFNIPQTPWPYSSSLTNNSFQFDESAIGSNSWAVTSSLSSSQSALVANDMHLPLSVPNIWYRASWFHPETGNRITGATLPGAPLMVVGSNGSAAWGFTNHNGDFSDVIQLQTNQANTMYLTPLGWENFQVRHQTIRIAGSEPVKYQIKETRWGPVIGEDDQGNLLAHRWTAYDIEGANLKLLSFESFDKTEQFIEVAGDIGIPQLNLVVGDKYGNIGWTTAGSIPNRNGFDGNTPEDWSDGSKFWQGYLENSAYPTIFNPDHHRLWTANARVGSWADQKVLGWNDMAFSARSQQIRDRLFEKDSFNEKDFLAIQLDNEAKFLNRWQRKLAELASTLEIGRAMPHFEYKRLINNWGGRASVDSVGYRLVREFRRTFIINTFGPLLSEIKNQHSDFDTSAIDNYLEYPAWELIEQLPEHLIPKGYSNWEDCLTQSIIDSYNNITRNGGLVLSNRTWGEANQVKIQHPLTLGAPFLSAWLNMPTVKMPGDHHMPRVQSSAFGASQRMVVSPGFEQDGFFHMATGQSGHPLSPYFDTGHNDWVKGNPSRFLPGPTEWELVLTPNEVK